MRILIDIGHPRHVHLLKNFILKMEARGHGSSSYQPRRNEPDLLTEISAIMTFIAGYEHFAATISRQKLRRRGTKVGKGN